MTSVLDQKQARSRYIFWLFSVDLQNYISRRYRVAKVTALQNYSRI
jgi:hypothetical protein